MTKKILQELLKERKFAEIKEILSTLNEVDLAEILEQMDDERDMIRIFRLIRKQDAAATFSYMSPQMQEVLISSFNERELRQLVDEMFLDDTVDLLEEMPANVVERILSVTDKATRGQINRLLSYPEDSAGSIMTVEYVDLKRDMTVGDAIRKIRRTGINKETIYTCYVIERKRLVGIVTVKDLLTSPDDTLVGDIMETGIICADTYDDQEDVAKKFQKYGFIAIPVVDKESCMVGIITHDDAMDVMQDEVQEDITRMSAVLPSEQTYFGTSVLTHARNRIVWLMVLMLASTVTGAIITKYEKAFAAIPILVSFITMLTSTGGNCGSQASTMVIRGLAMDEIRLGDFLKVAFKELRIAIVCGIALAAVNGLRVLVVYKNPTLALLIALSLVATAILSKLIGSMLPMLAMRIGWDPAIMSAPLISTLVDTTSILIYFHLATLLFGIQM